MDGSAPSLSFHGALQRMLVALREIHHLGDLGFCDLVGKHAHNRQPLLVDRQHEIKRLCVAHTKEPLKHMDNEFHRREIVIQDQERIYRRMEEDLNHAHERIRREDLAIYDSLESQRRDILSYVDSRFDKVQTKSKEAKS